MAAGSSSHSGHFKAIHAKVRSPSHSWNHRFTPDIYLRDGHSSESLSSAAEELPLTNIIKSHQESEIRATAGVVDMRFSNDSKTLTAVTEPYKRGPTEPLQYDIMIWDVVGGSMISVIKRELGVSVSALSSSS